MELFSSHKSIAVKVENLKTSVISENQKSSKKSTQSLTNSFKDLGLCDWVCSSASSMGYKSPTDIQKICIPAILCRRDVLACAQTGSGKTAAFALPILQLLSEDPFGIFALILTPTRELAMQISEQIRAFGTTFGARVAVIIGGMSLIDQSLALSKKPHILIATPGRLKYHLEKADPPDIMRAQFLVLDEADRLLSGGFSEELDLIINKMSSKRQTLLFSATFSESIERLQTMDLSNALRFDLTVQHRIPQGLLQNYLFIPAKVKTCYLIATLLKQFAIVKPICGDNQITRKQKSHHTSILKSTAKNEESIRSMIIFVSSCYRCQEIHEILDEMNFESVALHSLMNQTLRFDSLDKFKSRSCRILVATDVGSRGLDIPEVDLVINFDLPKISSDYVHRIGRTARAGRSGKALSFVTQYDIDLVHEIEKVTGQKMSLFHDITETDIIPILNIVSKAMRLAQMKLLDSGFDDKLATSRKRKKQQNRKILNMNTTDSTVS